MLDRRDFMATATLAAGVTAAISAPMAASASSPATKVKPSGFAPAGIDRDRAAFLMQQVGIDALVIEDPVNLGYFIGHRPNLPRLGIHSGVTAIVPRDAKMPITLLYLQFPYYYMTADMQLAPGIDLIIVTGPSDNGAAEPFFFRDIPGDKPTSREVNRRQETMAAAPFAPSMEDAARRAFGELGLGSARLGYDNLIAMQLIGTSAPRAEAVFSENLVKHIRLIKTAQEIELMTAASSANVAAAVATGQKMRSLGTISEARKFFNQKAMSLGNSLEFLVIDGVIDPHFDAELVEGTTVLLDAVTSYHGYHGDYGRAVFIGEPTLFMQKRIRIMNLAWNELRTYMAPGIRFSEISERGQEILQKLGGGVNIPFSPHCVGLAHTEQPFMALDGSPLDITLEPGMIISVDCPMMENGTKGTAHLEDLTLITEDGSKPIHDVGEGFILS